MTSGMCLKPQEHTPECLQTPDHDNITKLVTNQGHLLKDSGTVYVLLRYYQMCYYGIDTDKTMVISLIQGAKSQIS